MSVAAPESVQPTWLDTAKTRDKEQIMRRITRLIVMTGVLMGCWLLASSTSQGDDGPLNVGDAVPAFEGQNDEGQTWKSQDHIGKELLVVYFYASDFSFCCTRQAAGYRDRLQKLKDQGAEVIGISGDAVEVHRQFQSTHKLNFRLLSDLDGGIAQKFGVPVRMGGKAIIADKDGHVLLNAQGKPQVFPRNVTATRGTFVIDPAGRLIYQNLNVSAVNDSQAVLEFLRQRDTK